MVTAPPPLRPPPPPQPSYWIIITESHRESSQTFSAGFIPDIITQPAYKYVFSDVVNFVDIRASAYAVKNCLTPFTCSNKQ
jgi:hypothetical protein